MLSKIQIADRLYDQALTEIVGLEIAIDNHRKQIIAVPHHQQNSIVEITKAINSKKGQLETMNRFLRTIQEKMVEYAEEEVEEKKKLEEEQKKRGEQPKETEKDKNLPK